MGEKHPDCKINTELNDGSNKSLNRFAVNDPLKVSLDEALAHWSMV